MTSIQAIKWLKAEFYKEFEEDIIKTSPNDDFLYEAIGGLKEIIDDIDTLSDEELVSVFKNYYKSYLEEGDTY